MATSMDARQRRRQDQLLWMSWRYHEKRAAFLQRLMNLNLFIGLLTGATIVGAPSSTWTVVAGGFLAVFNAAVIAYRVTDLATLHLELRNEFQRQLHRFRNANDDFERSDVLDEKDRLDQREPAARKCALETICHNEYCRSIGKPRFQYEVSGWQRLTAHWLDHANVVFKRGEQKAIDSQDSPTPV